MPTYEYMCRSCGARFEAWQKITDDPIETCPTCGNAVHRVLYPVGLVFKGGGFYKTDSRSVGSAAEPAGEVAGDGQAKKTEQPASPGAGEAASEKKPSPSSAGGASGKPAAAAAE
jgi:putative FmdB family regulatory protein